MTRNYFVMATAFLAAASPARAELRDARGYEKITASVFVGDLDPGSPADAARLRDRVEQAARKACGRADHTDRAAVATVAECLDSVRASANAIVAQGIAG